MVLMGEGLMAQAQELFPEGFLDFVQGLVVVNRPGNRILEILENASEIFGGKDIGFG